MLESWMTSFAAACMIGTRGLKVHSPDEILELSADGAVVDARLLGRISRWQGLTSHTVAKVSGY